MICSTTLAQTERFSLEVFCNEDNYRSGVPLRKIDKIGALGADSNQPIYVVIPPSRSLRDPGPRRILRPLLSVQQGRIIMSWQRIRDSKAGIKKVLISIWTGFETTSRTALES